jgi:teichuronic acid biosynthesis glycosyltransferase TuaC
MAANLAPGRLETTSLAIPRPTTEKLRVLAVIPGDDRGSSMVFIRRQIASLACMGLDVRTYWLLSRTSPFELVKDWRRIRHEIRQFRPQLVHAHFGTMTSFLCAAVSATVPLVITFRGSDLNGDPEVTFLRSLLGRLLSQISSLRSSRIICVSRQLCDRLWWGQSRAVVIPTGVDLHLFRPQPKDQARAVLGWKQDELSVVFHGGNRPQLKGLQFVQAAVRFAQKTLGPIRLVNLDGSVPPESVAWCLNAADCLALASVHEGSPNIVKEALACNLPVVATDVGDVAERLKEVHPSRVVCRDVSEFGRALTDILLERRASNGRQRVESLSEAHIAEAIRSVYESAVERVSSATSVRSSQQRYRA